MTRDEALAQLRAITTDPPTAGPIASREDAEEVLAGVAELRLAVEAAAAALRQEEDRAIYSARQVLRDYGDATRIGESVGRSRQHVNTVVRERRRIAQVEQLERERIAG